MKLRVLLLGLPMTLFLLVVGLASGEVLRPDRQLLVKISIRGDADLALVESSGLPVFSRQTGSDGRSYLLAGLTPDQHRISGLEVTVLDSDMAGATYLFVYVMPDRLPPAWGEYGVLLLDDGIRVLLRVSPGDVGRLAAVALETQALTLDPKPLRPAAALISRSILANPDPLVEAMLGQIDNAVVYAYSADLSGERPVEIDTQPYTITTRHTYSGEPIRQATRYVGEHLAALGMQVDYHQWGAAAYPNVIGELTGVADPNRIFLIGAHLDDMPTGPIAPGADDNASGVVATLIAADILSQYPWNCTLRFAFWTGEEQWLLGSSAYALRSYQMGEQIIGYLNLDMIGYNTPLSLPGIDLHADADLPETLVLARLFADVVDAYGLNLLPEIVPNGTGASDHASFWQYGYTAILGIEDFSDFNPHYHSTDDRLGNLDLGYMTDFVKASIGTFVHMGDCICLPASEPAMTWSPANPVAGRDAVSFASTISGTKPFTYTWDLGGPGYGAGLDSATPVFTYTIPGNYTVTLMVENGCGSDSVSATVDVQCLPPGGDLLANDPVLLREPMQFTTTLAGTLPLSYSWDFGGEGVLVGVESLNPVFVYADAGVHTVTLSLENSCGAAHLERRVEVTDRWFVYVPLLWAGL